MGIYQWKVVAGTRKRPAGVLAYFSSRAAAERARARAPYATHVVRVLRERARTVTP